MGEELRSWLKIECQDTSLHYIDAVVSVACVVENAFSLDIPGRAIPASEELEACLKHALNSLEHIKEEYFPIDEKVKINNLASAMKDNIAKLKYPPNTVEKTADTIQKQAIKLQGLIHKNLAEGIVTCQCGKPKPLITHSGGRR